MGGEDLLCQGASVAVGVGLGIHSISTATLTATGKPLRQQCELTIRGCKLANLRLLRTTAITVVNAISTHCSRTHKISAVHKTIVPAITTKIHLHKMTRRSRRKRRIIIMVPTFRDSFLRLRYPGGKPALSVQAFATCTHTCCHIATQTHRYQPHSRTAAWTQVSQRSRTTREHACVALQ